MGRCTDVNNEGGLDTRPSSLYWQIEPGVFLAYQRLNLRVKSTCLTAKFGSSLDYAETGEKGQNVASSSVQHMISLIFAIHASFIIPLPMMWILLSKPMIMKKSVTIDLYIAVLLD